MIRVERIHSFAAARLFFAPLLEAHYREVGNTKVYTLDPDWDKYHAIEDLGNLVTLVAFDDDVTVGYSITFMAPHIHYIQQRVAYSDVLFVSKKYRTGSAGGRLIKATSQAVKAEGCAVMQWGAKLNTALDTVLRKRFPHFENIYQEVL